MQHLAFPSDIEALAQELEETVRGACGGGTPSLLAIDAADDVILGLLALGLGTRIGVGVVNGHGGDGAGQLLGDRTFEHLLVREAALGELDDRIDEVVAEVRRGDDVYALARMAGDAPERYPDGLVLFTSGSSGERKPVLIGYDALLGCSRFMNEAMAVTADDAEAIYAQLDHAFAIGRVVSCALAGARFEVLGGGGRMTPAAVQRILDVEGLTGLACMPSLLLRMVSIDQLREQFAERLRYAQVGAMYLPPERKLELVERLPSTRIFAHYGMTEYMRATFYDLSQHPGKAHTEGRASGATEIRIEPRDDDDAGPVADDPDAVVGEILLRGPFLADGYLDTASWRSRLTDDGYLRTGDVGYLDADGFLVHCGRSDSLFNVHGRLFSAARLERDLVGALPALDGRICVLPLRRKTGIKDSEILVFVAAGDEEPTDRDITRVFAAQGLSIEVLRLPGDLPRTSTGKVAYPELRALALG